MNLAYHAARLQQQAELAMLAAYAEHDEATQALALSLWRMAVQLRERVISMPQPSTPNRS